MQWPEGFMWGSGASSTQCEGASAASDWWDWERAGHAPLSGDGNGFATRYADDFRLLDPIDPAACIARTTQPSLRPDHDDEQHGQVDNVCFAQGLARFPDQWFLYYGMADSRIGCATAPAA